MFIKFEIRIVFNSQSFSRAAIIFIQFLFMSEATFAGSTSILYKITEIVEIV